jgi:molybdate/tungstate transport system permease protein
MKRNSFRLLFSILGSTLILFIIVPIINMLVTSSPKVLIDTFTDREFIRSISLTFTASGIATFVTLFTGLPLAYLLARFRFPGKSIVESIIDLPVVIPHTAAGIALLMVYGSRGVFGKAVAAFGINFIDSLAGIVVAMAFISLPYLVNLSRTAFASIDVELEQAAYVDGASSFQNFRMIVLPLARRGIFSGVLMMWARGISEFGAVVILAYNPKIIPVLIFEKFQGFGLEAAQPLAVLLILIVLLIFVILRILLVDFSDPDKK